MRIAHRIAPPHVGPVPRHGGEHHDAKTVSIRATATGFVPKMPTIPAGVDVKLVVDVGDAPACAKSLAIPSLGIEASADSSGKVTLSIPSQKPGSTLDLQCSMGMLKTMIHVAG